MAANARGDHHHHQQQHCAARRAAAAAPPLLLPAPEWEEKASVVYFLCKNGQLEHPHFMEVVPSSRHGLHLRDVVGRLAALRGEAMARMYSWSAKRRYRNGFVWHDLAMDDVVQPVHGDEYVLKGTELMPAPGTPEPATPPSSRGSCKTAKQHGVAVDASTQTYEELMREEVSPPPATASSSSPETTATEQCKLIGTGEVFTGKARAGPAVLMHLIPCGLTAAKDVRRGAGPRRAAPARSPKCEVRRLRGDGGGGGKEYHSGSLPAPGKATATATAAALRRSSSFVV